MEIKDPNGITILAGHKTWRCRYIRLITEIIANGISANSVVIWLKIKPSTMEIKLDAAITINKMLRNILWVACCCSCVISFDVTSGDKKFDMAVTFALQAFRIGSRLQSLAVRVPTLPRRSVKRFAG